MAEEIVPIIIFIVVGYIVKLVLDYRLKRRLIEKGEVNDKIQNLYYNLSETSNHSSLKMGNGIGRCWVGYSYWTNVPLSNHGRNDY